MFFGVEGMIRKFFKGRSLLGDRFKFFLFATFYFVFYLGICLYFLLSGSVSFVDFVDEFSYRRVSLMAFFERWIPFIV